MESLVLRVARGIVRMERAYRELATSSNMTVWKLKADHPMGPRLLACEREKLEGEPSGHSDADHDDAGRSHQNETTLRRK